MKLLFDENLARQLVRRLADLFPETTHVIHLELESTPDSGIWHYAAAHGYAIVTQDSDFVERSAVEGAPPKVIWIHLGNSVTSEVERLLRVNHIAIVHFLDHPTEACLILERSSGMPFLT